MGGLGGGAFQMRDDRNHKRKMNKNGHEMKYEIRKETHYNLFLLYHSVRIVYAVRQKENRYGSIALN